MRQTWRLGVGLLMLLAVGLRADPVPNMATVIAAEAEVRSGAGNAAQMYPTNRLRKGDAVEVIREIDGGWLAIKPPTGSFSWVNSRFVKQVDIGRPSWVVVAPQGVMVPVLFGSTVRKDRPTVEAAKVTRGTLLRSVGAMQMADDGYWLPVTPPPSEVRYIRAEAVSRKPSAPGVIAAGPPGLPAPPGQFTPPAAPPTTVPGSPAASAASGGHPLWVRAQQAEQVGRNAEAIQLYRQLGAEVANTNHTLSVQAYNRAQWLADRTPGVPGNEARSPIAMTTSRSIPPPGSQPGTVPAGLANSGPGVLRRAGRCIDYSTLYVLENSQGLPILYATAQSGYSLESYLNRNIELHGVRQFRADLRAYHMTVMQVQPLR